MPRYSAKVPLSLVTLVAIFLLWWWVAFIGMVPKVIVPSPLDVITEVFTYKDFSKSLFRLFIESTVGLLLAVVGAYGIALAYQFFPRLRLSSYPLLVVFQSFPLVMFAPILLIAFGYTWWVQISTALLLAFFPLALACDAGLRRVPRAWLDVLRSAKCSDSQIIWKVRLPASVGVFLPSLRTAASLSVVGAIVGEFFGADYGLGVTILIENNTLDAARTYLCAFGAAGEALLLVGAVWIFERRVMSRYLRELE